MGRRGFGDWEVVKGRVSKRLNGLFVTCADKEFCVIYFKLLNFVHPNLKKVTVIQEEKESDYKVVHVYSNKPSWKG